MSNPLKSFDAWDPIKHSSPGAINVWGSSTVIRIAVWVHTPYLDCAWDRGDGSCRTFKFPNMLTMLTVHGKKL